MSGPIKHILWTCFVASCHSLKFILDAYLVKLLIIVAFLGKTLQLKGTSIILGLLTEKVKNILKSENQDWGLGGHQGQLYLHFISLMLKWALSWIYH